MRKNKKIYIKTYLAYDYKLTQKEFTHGSLIDNPYSGLVGKEYVLFTNSGVYFIKSPIFMNSKQIYKNGLSYEELGVKKYSVLNVDYYFTIQHINKYVQELKVII